MGGGGGTTTLGVYLERRGTHTAVASVAVSNQCWASRGSEALVSEDSTDYITRHVEQEDLPSLNKILSHELSKLQAGGDVYRLSFSLESDLYYTQDFTPTGETNEFNGLTGRIFPLAQLDWSKPFAKSNASVTQIIEPKASLILAPNGSNPSDIPNEDSQEFEFDETSLFRSNKFSGDDRVESGTRIDYGAHWGVYGKSGGKTTAFVGQSYRLRKDSIFQDNSGLEEKLSDIVAKFEVSPGQNFDLIYRTRIGKSNAEIKRNEITMSAGAPLFRLNTRYQFFERQEGSEFGGREDLNIGFTSKINRYWRADGNILHDIADEETRRINFGITYEDECLIFDTAISRTFFSDRDLEPDDAIMFTVNFKTFGGVTTDVF